VHLHSAATRGALSSIAANLDESAREMAERRSRAEGRGGRPPLAAGSFIPGGPDRG
jgi:hypothetical protein